MVPADYVWLNRGNHEDRSQNQFYCRGKHGCWGFIEEIFFKYASIGVLCNKMYNWIEACFHMLPIATLINESVRVSLVSCCPWLKLGFGTDSVTIITLPSSQARWYLRLA